MTLSLYVWVSLNQPTYMNIQVLVFEIWEQILSDLCDLFVFNNSNNFAAEMNQCLNDCVYRVVQTLVKNSLYMYF